MNTDGPGFQQLLEDRRQLCFERCSRRQIRLRAVEAGSGQSFPIELAGRAERKHVEGDDHCGNHVGGKETSQLGAHAVRVDRGAGLGDDVADQAVTDHVVVMDESSSLRDTGQPEQRCFDLGEFDALAADLDLEIASTDVVEQPVGAPPDDITGSVHPGASRAVRIGHESVGGEIAAPEVSTRQLHSRQVQLAVNADRNGMQPPVEDIELGVPHRRTDGNGDGHVWGEFGGAHVDGSLRGSVQVEQSCRTQTGERLRGGGSESFTAAEHLTQACALPGSRDRDEFREHRRNEVRRRDAFFGHQRRQVPGITVPLRFRDHQLRTSLQGPEQFPHRDVEGHRSLVQHHVRRVKWVRVLHPQKAIDDRTV